jgi:O-methyltransferase involved in polyketide biosynthesis
VIIRAGLDTFAFRRHEFIKKIQVLEVDHPATQSCKRKRLAELGWELPANLHFIPWLLSIKDSPLPLGIRILIPVSQYPLVGSA